MPKPCGCAESKAIREYAESQGRPMRRDEALEALAADLNMTVDEIVREMRNQRALASWRRRAQPATGAAPSVT